MSKLFICPKCHSENVRVYLQDGTILKSLKTKLSVEKPTQVQTAVLNFKRPLTRCLDCHYEFTPKCIGADDVV